MEPRTAATAATTFAGFLDSTAFVAYGTDGRRREWFAGIHALKPPVINMSVADSSAVLKPSTAGSTTTDSTGFIECATLWAHYLIR